MLGHALLLGGIEHASIGSRDEAGAPMSVRTLPAEPAAEPATEPVDVVAAPAPAPPAPPPPRPRLPRSVREPARPASDPEPTVDPVTQASDRFAEAGVAAPTIEAPASQPPASTQAEPDRGLAPPEAASAAASAPRPSLLAAGEQPPPVYRTLFPAPVTLRYEVRSGFFRGTGEIRWRRVDDGYRLSLDARVAGLTLLRMTSEGSIDAAGLAPDRFVDQRARRSAQAANFRRDQGSITFSGPAVEWTLLAGSQDQLSWMIQLAAIASAQPELLVEGGRIAMVVVGARGDARVWTLRYTGREIVETAAGTVNAVKLVRDGTGTSDRSYEIWLDPEHAYLPAHVTQRGSGGKAELDLLLEAIEPAP
ncbi:MAG: DUF3108 domain-containing protein [Caldimonas sp.]